MPLATPYYVTMNLDQFVGRKGIEIVGASRKVRRDVPRSQGRFWPYAARRAASARSSG
jgi:hypothetical protein